jgi:hypothetical protein
MLVGDKDTVLLIPAFTIGGVPQGAYPGAAPQPISAITSALLNYYIPVVTPASTGGHWGGNVTCDVVDDWKLQLKDSSTSPLKTLCSVGNANELTYYNFDAQMNFLRDISGTDTASTFNLPTYLTQAPDIPYLIAHRVGYDSQVAAAAGQEWNFYYVWTDLQIPASGDGVYMEIGETFVQKGLLNFKSILGS